MFSGREFCETGAMICNKHRPENRRASVFWPLSARKTRQAAVFLTQTLPLADGFPSYSKKALKSINFMQKAVILPIT